MTQWTVNQMPDQSGRIAVVTGANSGLGYETSLALARKGAQVVMACRNMEKGQKAFDDIRKLIPDTKLELMQLDLSSLESVRTFAADYLKRYDQLDLLINNAGVMAIPRRETVDGFEMQFGTNHLGHFALTGLLLDVILKTPGSRIVNVSSVAHTMGTINFDDLHGEKEYTRYGAYGQSKLANLLFTFELQRKLEITGAQTISVAAHPGYSATNLQHVPAQATNNFLDKLLTSLGNRFMAQSQEMGTLPQLYAAVAPDVKGGAYYGPDGFMETRGYPTEVQARPKAHDRVVAERLWQVSEELTGVTYQLPVPQ